jgi:hypothetical protein
MLRFSCLFFILFILCSNSSWLSYSIRYASSEEEKNKFIKELINKKIEYRIYNCDSYGIYEIHYKPNKLDDLKKESHDK